MGKPRASRRKVVTISSDEDEESQSQALPSEASEDNESVKHEKRSGGKLRKPIKKLDKSQKPTPATPSRDRQAQKSPAKTKTTKVKSKTTPEDQPKPTGRPIYSFFSAVTQGKQGSQPSASPENRRIVHDEPDAIHDISDESPGPAVEPSKASSTALVMRKRKLARKEGFETDASLPLPASQKFRKASSGERVPSLSVFNEDKRPWSEQFAPKDLTELAVHKGKVSDVRKWLEGALNGRRQKVLVLKGAAGTGKTTTLRLLAHEMNLKVVEWQNPAATDQSSHDTTSTASQFQDFVGRAGRSGGLQFVSLTDDGSAKHIEDDNSADAHRQVLLVEEFPSTFSRTSSTLQNFRSTTLQYVSSPALANSRPTPIVMIISETLLSTNTALADSFTAHRLMGPELIDHPFLDVIEFNPVARTILTKAMDTVVVKEARKSGRRKAPGTQVIKQLAESGDIRSAISSLEFLCLRGDEGDTWSTKITFTKQQKPKTDPKMTKHEEEAMKLICNRESTLGIFHAVGKVMYNKRQEPPPSEPLIPPPAWLPQHRRNKAWENNADEILNELGTDVSTFVAALHENYALSCSCPTTEDSLDSLTGCMTSISDADLLSVDRFSFGTRAFSGSASDSLRQDEMAFQTAVRGLLFSFPYPVTRVARAGGKRGEERQMFYPTSLKLWRKREELESTLELLTSKLQGDSITGIQSSGIKQNAALSGVENWKSNTSTNVELPVPMASDSTTALRSSSAKAEMLIERLPYIAQIMASRAPSSLLDSITSVTRVRGAFTSTDEDEDEEGEESSEAVPEQWATDRPETDLADGSKRVGVGVKKGDARGTEGGGLATPVESRIEKLLLEDDDIVDD